ncbi:MAG TPA: RidA family protein [Burkholderiales bacterium]|nr:RidA family protein [Burkholderiales bacterium]
MSGRIARRLGELRIALPEVTSPVANYVPYTVAGSTAYIAGQVCMQDGKLTHVGKLGKDLDLQSGQAAARICAINILAVLRVACGGDLDRVKRCLRLGGFVNAMPEFTDVPMVVNGASDLVVDVFGDAGRHARTAIGVAALPRGAAVEVDAIFEIA